MGHNMYNREVFVVRQYDGAHVQGQRYVLMEQVANAALDKMMLKMRGKRSAETADVSKVPEDCTPEVRVNYFGDEVELMRQ